MKGAKGWKYRQIPPQKNLNFLFIKYPEQARTAQSQSEMIGRPMFEAKLEDDIPSTPKYRNFVKTENINESLVLNNGQRVQ